MLIRRMRDGVGKNGNMGMLEGGGMVEVRYLVVMHMSCDMTWQPGWLLR